MKRIVRVLWPHLRRHRRLLTWAGLAMIGEVITAVLTPWPLKFVMDDIVFHHRKLRTIVNHHVIVLLVTVSIVMLVIALFDALFTYLDNWVTSLVAQRSVNGLRFRCSRTSSGSRCHTISIRTPA